MNEKYLFGSLARIAPFDEREIRCEPFPRTDWRGGQYVVGEALERPGAFRELETRTGRMTDVGRGDLVVGVLGRRFATLETVGDWREIGEDLELEALTSAMLFGRVTSRSSHLPPMMSLSYKGHVWLDGKPVAMDDFVPPAPESPPPLPPVVLIVGTSMSAGKTTTGRIVVRQLRQAGLRVAGAKITGAGRFRDILSLRDAGARPILDFVDVGLGSTVCPAETYRPALKNLLARLAASEVDVAVIEAGASPLEPYNGQVAVEELGDRVCFTILCASDPYAVLGVMEGFGRRPDLVAGLATSTQAGVELVERLANVPAANILDPTWRPVVRNRILDALGKTQG